MPDWRSRWRVRSGLGQRPPSPGPEGCDLGGGAAHVARPLDRRPAEQGRARRAGAAAAGGPGARWRRSGGGGPGSGGAGGGRGGGARDGGGGVVRAPDREVQERIGLVFASFLELGSVGKVLRSFRAHALTVPRRDRFGEVSWRTPTDGMISAILKNPAYAGTFVYGRTRSCRATYASGKLITARCPMAEWKVVVKDRYPAYVGWEDFERIQAMRRDNHAEYARNQTR